MSIYQIKNGDDIYITIDGKEQYCVNSKGHQFYAKKAGRREYYAKHNQEDYYAVSKDKSEFYVKAPGGRDLPIKRGDVEIYARDAKKAEIYPKDSYEKEFLLNKNGVAVYAKDEFGIEKYPKNKHGEEYVQNSQIKLPDGKIKLPTSSDGRPIYHKIDGKEIYLKDADSKYYFCKNRMGDEVYAKDKYGIEYYPDTPKTYALKRDGEPYYAVDTAGLIVYPKNADGEHYIETPKGSFHILKNFKQHFIMYARQKNKEIYPVNSKKSEMVMNDTYATADLTSNEQYYPRDSNKNEYTIGGEFINDYPITSDGYIIVPNIDNKPTFFKSEVIEFQKLLYRPDTKTYDFLTHVRSKRPAVSITPTYKTLNLELKNTMIFYYIIVALVVIIVALLTTFFK